MQVRKTVVEWLEGKGLLRGTQDNEMSVPFCSRSKDIIEPVLKPQWWVDCQGMAQDGIKAVQDGSLEIIPAEFEATWYRYSTLSVATVELRSCGQSDLGPVFLCFMAHCADCERWYHA